MIAWKPDADPTLIDDFLKAAPGQLDQGPFLTVEHGVSVRAASPDGNLTAQGSIIADWGFIVELADASDASHWKESQAHLQMEANLSPILGTMTVLCWSA